MDHSNNELFTDDRCDVKNEMIVSSESELYALDKEQLIGKIISMQQHIKQLKSLIHKLQQQQQQQQSKQQKLKVSNFSDIPISTDLKKKKSFDFSRYKVRHIFLKFLYLGWNYDGFVVQEDTLNTIEAALFDALLKTKLIRCRESANYHRCGRTDKGVSAFEQVISLTVRSQLKNGVGIFKPDDYSLQDCDDDQIDSEAKSGPDEPDFDSDEIDYISALNGVLPKDIRVTAWTPIADVSSSARFDCTQRTYRYFFPRGQLRIDRMNDACRYLIGEHDFRNLCKMDVNNGVINYMRKVISASVEIAVHEPSPYTICVFRIEATAFLWHQIRAIMAILLLVGREHEPPSIVAELLNIEKNPRKPQYKLAADLPLVLYEAKYADTIVPRWYHRNETVLRSTIAQMLEHWTKYAIKTSIIKSMIDSLVDEYRATFHESLCFEQIDSRINTFLCGLVGRTYRPLFDRPLCSSLQDRLEKRQAKKRIKLDL